MSDIIWEYENRNDDCYYSTVIDEHSIMIQINYYGLQSFGIYIEQYDEPVVEKEQVHWTRVKTFLDAYLAEDSKLPSLEEFRKIFNCRS